MKLADVLKKINDATRNPIDADLELIGWEVEGFDSARYNVGVTDMIEALDDEIQDLINELSLLQENLRERGEDVVRGEDTDEGA